MIELNSISKVYSENTFFFKNKSKISAISRISLTIKRPSIVGIFGSNGSGKSTLIKLLSGIIFPSTGSISVLGFNPFNKETDFLKKISLYISKTNQIDDELTAYSYCLLQKDIYQISNEKFNLMIKYILKELKIESLLHKQVKKLSFGQRAMVEIASLFITYPKIIFLDEPMIGIDENNKKILVLFIRKYQKKFKSYIIFSSNDILDINSLAKEVLLLSNGILKKHYLIR